MAWDRKRQLRSTSFDELIPIFDSHHHHRLAQWTGMHFHRPKMSSPSSQRPMLSIHRLPCTGVAFIWKKLKEMVIRRNRHSLAMDRVQSPATERIHSPGEAAFDQDLDVTKLRYLYLRTIPIFIHPFPAAGNSLRDPCPLSRPGPSS